MGVLVDDPGLLQILGITVGLIIGCFFVCCCGGGFVLFILYLVNDSRRDTNASVQTAKASLPNASGRTRLAEASKKNERDRKAQQARLLGSVAGGFTKIATGGVV